MGESILDGPTFVEFDPKQRHRYLMFLKNSTAKEGIVDHFEPLTGLYHPNQSFRLLERYHISKERVKIRAESEAGTKDEGAVPGPGNPRGRPISLDRCTGQSYVDGSVRWVPETE